MRDASPPTHLFFDVSVMLVSDIYYYPDIIVGINL